MSVLDSHLHIWDPPHLRYPWIEGDPRLDRPFTAADYEVGTSDVTSIVFVQADCLAEQGLDEVAWVDAVAESRALPIDGIVAFAPLEHAHLRGQWLDALQQHPRVKGVRRLLQAEPIAFLEDPRLAEGLADLVASGLPFDAGVVWQQLPALTALIRRVPGLRVVLDHLGKPPVAAGWESDDARAWSAAIRDLAALDDVHVKLSGLGAETPEHLVLEEAAAPYLSTVLDAFGPDRCMVGSDWPVSTSPHGPRAYDGWFRLVLEKSGLDPAERGAVAGATGRRFYGLDTAGTAGRRATAAASRAGSPPEWVLDPIDPPPANRAAAHHSTAAPTKEST
jgi:L-fuconolactonase